MTQEGWRIVTTAPQHFLGVTHWTPLPATGHEALHRATTGQTQPQGGQLATAARSAVIAGLTAGLCPLAFEPAALCFDMDSTLIAQESIVVLAHELGLADRVEAITERAMAGELAFDAALRERVRLLQGLPIERLASVRERLTLSAGLRELVHAAKQRSLPLLMVSGGFHELADPIAERLGFAAVAANRLEVRDRRLTGRLTGDLIGRERKASWLRETCARLGLPVERTVAIGDGANDLDMLRLAGLSIGFAPKPVLCDMVDGATFAPDHRFVAALLGW